MTVGAALRTAARRVTRALSGGGSAGGFRRRFGSAAVPVAALARAARWVAAIGDSRPRLLGRPLWGGSLAALTSARSFPEEGEDGLRAHRSGPRSRSRESREPGGVSATTGRSPHRRTASGRTAHRTSKSQGWRPAGGDRSADRPAAPLPGSAARRVERATLARLAGSPGMAASSPEAEPRPRRTRSLPKPGGSGAGGAPRPHASSPPAREGTTSWRRSLEERSRRRLAAAVAGERATRGPKPDASSATDSTSREGAWSVPLAGREIRTEMLLRLVEPGDPAPAERMPDRGRSPRGGGPRGTDRESTHAAAPVAARPDDSFSGERGIGEASGGGPRSRDGKSRSGEPPARTSSGVPLSTWPWNRKAVSPSTDDRRLDTDLSPELPRRTAEGPEAAAGEGETPRLFERSPAEPREDDLERLARSLERLLGDEARRFGIDV